MKRVYIYISMKVDIRLASEHVITVPCSFGMRCTTGNRKLEGTVPVDQTPKRATHSVMIRPTLSNEGILRGGNIVNKNVL